MKARVQWLEGRTCGGQSGRGHAVVMERATEAGGRNLGIRPMEMLLVGLAGCTAFDVGHILEKGREAITECDVEAKAERAPTDPKIFTAIHLTYRLKGRNLKEAAEKRAIDLSAGKYCSASIMLAKTAKITHSWAIEEA